MELSAGDSDESRAGSGLYSVTTGETHLGNGCSGARRGEQPLWTAATRRRFKSADMSTHSKFLFVRSASSVAEITVSDAGLFELAFHRAERRGRQRHRRLGRRPSERERMSQTPYKKSPIPIGVRRGEHRFGLRRHVAALKARHGTSPSDWRTRTCPRTPNLIRVIRSLLAVGVSPVVAL